MALNGCQMDDYSDVAALWHSMLAQITCIQMKMCDGNNFRSDKRNNKYTLMRAYIITSIQVAAV